LFDEIIPATDLPADQARAFANQVLERFANPWLEHEYRVIATNQLDKFKIRVVPLIVSRALKRRLGDDASPEGLALATAAHLTYTGAPLDSLAEAARIPGFVAATKRWMAILARDGALAAVRDSIKRPP
jgi:mannitol-1-phosphate/altronate dehydrogenase